MSTESTQAAVVTGPPAGLFSLIALNTIAPSGTNPRKTFDEKKLAELAESIGKVGVIQPCVARPWPESVNPPAPEIEYELIAGERRWRASKLAGADKLPVIIRQLSDESVLEIQVVENLQREDVLPLEEADGYKSLQEKLGYTLEDIGMKVGKPPEYVAGRISLLKLTADGRKLLADGTLPIGHAQAIARLGDEDQAEALGVCVQEVTRWNKNQYVKSTVVATLREVESFINSELLLKLSAAPWKRKDANLLPEAGACSACSKRTGANTLLFPELGQRDDRCLDSDCYDRKFERHIDVTLESLGPNAPRLSNDYREIKDTLSPSEFRALEKKDERCGYVEQGVYINGPLRGKVQDICRSAACPVHGSRFRGNSRTDPEEAARVAEQKEQEKQDLATRNLIVEDAVLAWNEKMLSDSSVMLPFEVLKLVCKDYLRLLSSDKRKAALKRRTGEEKDATRGLEKWIDDAGMTELCCLLLECCLLNHLHPEWRYEYGGGITDDETDGDERLDDVDDEVDPEQPGDGDEEDDDEGFSSYDSRRHMGPDHLKVISLALGVNVSGIEADIEKQFAEARAKRDEKKRLKEEAERRKAERKAAADAKKKAAEPPAEPPAEAGSDKPKRGKRKAKTASE